MKHSKKLIALLLAAGLLAGCGQASQGTQPSAPKADDAAADAAPAAEREEGKDTNNGRPYNLSPVKYDKRDDKYLNGINGTKLPVSDEEIVIDVWCGFSSTIMQGLDECRVYQEMEKRTNVKINWIYPPVGSETDNYTMSIASDNLPHIFICPPGYPGGEAKAVSDEVYADLTPYYEKGLMPNFQYLCETYADIGKDAFNDEGRLLSFPQIDIVESAPWSGIWIRQDWLDELDMDVPVTIEDWDKTLRAMKELKGVAPLGINFNSFYGVATNYMFSAAYESTFRQFMNKDGKIEYGSMGQGYRDFLELMHTWYADGLIDPDFTTRSFEDYNACVARGDFGAFGLSYAELGQQKLTGTTLEPSWKVVPVKQPVLEEGQTIHMRQMDTRVRGYHDYMTTRAEDEGIADLIVAWKDYWYSQDGGDLCSYGVEGVSYEWNDDGEIDWIDPSLTENEDADFWTMYPKFKLHNCGYMRDSTSYTFEPEVFECIELWAEQDADWNVPGSLSFTEEEADEMADIQTDINSYVEEMTYRFVTGAASLDEYPAYEEQLKALGIERLTEIYQNSLDRYNAR